MSLDVTRCLQIFTDDRSNMCIYVCVYVCIIYTNMHTYMYVYMYATNIVCIFVSKGATPHCQYVLDKLQKDPNENQVSKTSLGFLILEQLSIYIGERREVTLGYKASFATNSHNRLLWPKGTDYKALWRGYLLPVQATTDHPSEMIA